MRRGLSETAEGLKAAGTRPPLFASLAADWRPMLQTFGIVATTNAAYYVAFTYIVERRRALAGGGGEFFLATTLSLVVVLLAKPLGGWLSDRTGRAGNADHTVTTMAMIVPGVRLMLEGLDHSHRPDLLAVPRDGAGPARPRWWRSSRPHRSPR